MKVLIVGLGSIAKKHIEAIKKIGPAEFFALRSSPDSKNEPGVTNLYSYEEVGNYNFDFYIISNPTSQHFDAINFLLKFRKPLFIEKPLFSNVGSVEQKLVQRITISGIPTYVGCSLRFLDCLNHIKDLIKGKRINEVNCYSGSFLPDWRPGSDFRKSYSANAGLGGGVHIDLIHELDYLYWIFGNPHFSRSISSSKSSLKINAVDYANYVWGYEDFNASIILNYYRRDVKRTFEIITDEETYLVDLINNKIHRNGTEIFSSEQTLIDTFQDQMDFFLKNILTEKEKNFNSVEEAYKILELCLKE